LSVEKDASRILNQPSSYTAKI